MAAYTIAYYPVLIVSGGILWLIYVLITRQFQTVLNIFISSYPGIVTEQTVAAAAFPTMILLCSPVIILFAIAFWAIVRGSGDT